MKKSKKLVTKTPKELAAALHLSSVDALEWEMRSVITDKIISSAQEGGLSVTELAARAGTSRARITRILKGDSLGISLDVLVRVLGALGEVIRISFKKAA
jgi:hypothetical protein